MHATTQEITGISVDLAVFAARPEYRRVVLMANVRDGAATDRSALGLALLEAHAAAREAVSAVGGEVAELPSIAAWREAFRAIGVNPSKFRPSVDALTRRVAGGHLVQTGIPLVDAGTAISLEQLVPVGIHVVDGLSGELALRESGSAETFTALDGSIESIPEHELVWACGEIVLTRRWVWRQGRPGSIDPDAPPRQLAVNVDLIDGLDNGAVDTATQLLSLCGVEVERIVELDAEHPRIELA